MGATIAPTTPVTASSAAPKAVANTSGSDPRKSPTAPRIEVTNSPILPTISGLAMRKATAATRAPTRMTGRSAMPTGIAAASRPPIAVPPAVMTGVSAGTRLPKPRISGPKFGPISASAPPKSGDQLGLVAEASLVVSAARVVAPAASSYSPGVATCPAAWAASAPALRRTGPTRAGRV